MLGDPNFLTTAARERQAEIAREMQALRAPSAAVSAADVWRSWVIALRSTLAFMQQHRII